MIEFAIVFPIVMIVSLGLFELARAQTVASSARTSLMIGAREASIANATAEQVVSEMEDILEVFGIKESKITITPRDFSDSSEVTVGIAVPFSSTNGMVLHQYLGGSIAEFSATIPR